jgi:hypothetical protein
MKKLVSVLVALTMLMALSGNVFARDLQQGISYSSGFQVANLSDSEATHIIVTYYPQEGTPVEVEDDIAAGGSVTYAAIHDAAGDPFNGSVVVSSTDTEIAAIVNTLGDFPAYAAATGGFSEGATEFSLPLVMCNNNGFDTWFNVQNAGSGDAEVTVTYLADAALSAEDTPASTTDTVTIGEGRAATFDQASGSSTKSCDSGLGEKFVGAAVIESNVPVVATVMQVNQAGFEVLMGYNGFASGATDVRAPLVMQNNGGFYTGIQVQNAGTTTTTVTIDFSSDTSGEGTVLGDLVFDLGPGASATNLQSGTERYIGSAMITADQPLVAIVNQVLPGAPSFGTAYESFAASDATPNINVPLVMSNNGGFYTGIQVQNVSDSEVEVTINYAPNTVEGMGNPSSDTFTLTAGSSKTLIQNGAAGETTGVNNWTARYVGSASITATGGNIVAIVNEANLTLAGDQFYTFDAFNY